MDISVDKALRKAKGYVQRNQMQDAERIFINTLARFPKSRKTLRSFASFVSAKGTQSASSLAPSDQLVETLIDMHAHDQFVPVINVLIPVITVFPKSVTFLNILGISLCAVAEYEKAIERFKTAIKIDPQCPDAFNNMGIALYETDNLQSAVEHYQKALSINSDYSDAHVNFGNALKGLGNYEAALTSYEQALMMASNYPEAYFNMGIAYALKDDLKRASDCYQNAVACRAAYPEAHNNLGVVLNEMGDFSAALKSYARAIELRTDYPEAHQNMGIALTAKGDLSAAVESFKKAVYHKVDYADAYNNMGDAQRLLGHTEAARHSYQNALTYRPGDLTAPFMLAVISGVAIKTVPTDCIEKLFNGYAENFDRVLLGKLDYQIPALLSESLLEMHIQSELTSILDLGCGTGLAMVEAHTVFDHIVGIDLSQQMLEKARNRGIYDQLVHIDIKSFLANSPLDFDVFIAADVFIYLGDLSEVFNLIRSRNKKLGRLVFSTEHSLQNDYTLEITRRFSHSKSYIDDLCEQFN